MDYPKEVWSVPEENPLKFSPKPEDLLVLVEVTQQVLFENNLGQALTRCEELVRKTIPANFVVIGLASNNSSLVRYFTSEQEPGGFNRELPAETFPDELAALAFKTGKKVHLQDLNGSKNINLAGFKAGLAFPFCQEEAHPGAIAIYRTNELPPFDEQDQLRLEFFSNLIGPHLLKLNEIDDLKQDLQARDNFLSIASHDLRNPLASLRGFTQLISRQVEKINSGQPFPQEKMVNYLQRVMRQADNLNEMIEKVLDFSRILSHRLELNLEEMDFVPLCNEVLTEFKAWLYTQESDLADEKKHLLDFKTQLPSFKTLIDPSRMRQIILSLMKNAVKFSPEGGRIEINISGEEEGALLSVRDSGPGIRPEEMESVFKRWQDPPDKRGAGLGVSLFIAREVMERFKGQVNFLNRPGEGTTFILKIPGLEAQFKLL